MPRWYMLAVLTLLGLFILMGAIAAHAAVKCGPSGSWDDESVSITAQGWDYVGLTDEESNLIKKTYEHQAHEKIDGVPAWEERYRHYGGLTQYSIVYVDGAGCVTFHLNFATAGQLKRMLDPGF